MSTAWLRGVAVCAWLASSCTSRGAPVEPAKALGSQPPEAPAPAASPSVAPRAPAEAASEAQAAVEPPERVRRSVELTILGDFPRELVADIEAALREQLGVQVMPTRLRELPADAYYPPRKRYRAEKLLDALEREKRAGIGQLGLTQVDISTTKGKHADWGVFGLGSLGGDSAVISTHRLRRDRPREELYRFRIVTTAVHEVGHMLGLEHCTEPRCVMNDAEGSIRTVDESDGRLGPGCRATLDQVAPKSQAPAPEDS